MRQAGGVSLSAALNRDAATPKTATSIAALIMVDLRSACVTTAEGQKGNTNARPGTVKQQIN